MAIRFKDGVDITGINKETIYAMSIADFYFGMHYQRNLVVTSVTDGVHRSDSKHYDGDAFDFRTWTTSGSGIQLSNAEKEVLAKDIQQDLGRNYDVVIERTHIHVEYDPKSVS